MVSSPILPQRTDLILREIDALPTLPAVATRLLTLTAGTDASADEVVKLIEADPPLTAKVLSLCTGADFGVEHVETVTEAVVLLGFDAVRNAVLSVKVMDFFESEAAEGAGDQGPGIRTETTQAAENASRPGLNAGPRTPTPALDRKGLWLHSVAVAIVAESIARSTKAADLPPDEAFVCGLLHDIGKLALDHVLPKGYGRVVELARTHQRDIAEFERKILGLDHHAAGERLATLWGLPLRLRDCISLHGSPPRTLPDAEHRRMIGLIRLADLLVRRQHVGYSGNHLLSGDPSRLAASLELHPQPVAEASITLFDHLQSRGQALGLHDAPAGKLRLEAMEQANAALGAANASLEARTRQTATQSSVLRAVSAFHAAATTTASLADVLDAVARSAAAFLGGIPLALVTTGCGTPPPASWRGCRYDPSGRRIQTLEFLPAVDAEGVTALQEEAVLNAAPQTLMPWLPPELLGETGGVAHRLMPLPGGCATAAWLIHTPTELPPWALLKPLAGAWGAAIASANQHEGTRQLGEQLAEADAALADMRDRLTAAGSLSRLGEVAAEAVHQMSDPLSVIAGRSHVLTLTLPEGSKPWESARDIFREAHRLSDLIGALQSFTKAPSVDCRSCDLTALIERACDKVRHSLSKQERPFAVSIEPLPPLPKAYLDAEQVERAVTELLVNAAQAEPANAVTVSVQHIESEATVLIRIADDAAGMEPQTLRKAFDPFYSAHPAGPRLGMGLPRARQIARAHGGDITLRSEPGRGTEATFVLPLDCPAASPDESV